MAIAVSLFSGSLASIIATRLIMEEKGVSEVKILHFRSPFFRDYERTKCIARELWDGISFRSQSVKKDFKELTNIPPNGCYDLKNSCMGCRNLMLRKGLRYMRRVNADFIVTGEVVGHRGLGVNEILRMDEKIGGDGLIIRPLSAKLLPPTKPEREGWIKRKNLKGLTAESKERIKEIANEFGIKSNIAFPSEKRCRLTQEDFGQRLEDLLREEKFTMNSLELLEFPLYYKRPPDVKIVLGLDDEEKRRLQNFFLPQDLRLYIPTHDGPMTLVRTNWEEKTKPEIESIIELAARITVTHSRVKKSKVQTNYRFENESETYRINVSPFESEEELKKYCVRIG